MQRPKLADAAKLGSPARGVLASGKTSSFGAIVRGASVATLPPPPAATMRLVCLFAALLCGPAAALKLQGQAPRFLRADSSLLRLRGGKSVGVQVDDDGNLALNRKLAENVLGALVIARYTQLPFLPVCMSRSILDAEEHTTALCWIAAGFVFGPPASVAWLLLRIQKQGGFPWWPGRKK